MGIQFKMDISWYHNTDDKGKQQTEIKSPNVMKGHHSAISSYKKKKKNKNESTGVQAVLQRLDQIMWTAIYGWGRVMWILISWSSGKPWTERKTYSKRILGEAAFSQKMESWTWEAQWKTSIMSSHRPENEMSM